MKRLGVLIVFLLVGTAQAVYVNDQQFHLGNNAWITMKSATLTNYSCCASNTFFMNVSNQPVTLTSNVNKTITLPTWVSDNYTMQVSGTAGYINFTVMMENASVSYNLSANGVYVESRNTTASGIVWFNYTGDATLSVTWNSTSGGGGGATGTPTFSMTDASYRVVASGTSITFTPTSDQSIDTYYWSVDGGSVSGTSSYTTSWERGLHYVMVYGTNVYGTSNTLEWRVSVNPLIAVAAVPTVNVSNFNTLRNATKNYQFENWLEATTLPFTDVMGNLFWLFLWSMIFAAYWIRQKKMTFPTVILLVFGFVIISMLPEEYQPVVRGIIALGVLGTIYLAFKERG